jgi:DNA transposition AAA+ family ATPase
MKVDTVANKIRLQAETDINAACRARLRDYLARTGLAIPDFAARIGYSRVSLDHFFANRYEQVAGSAHNLVRAIDEFIVAHPVGPVTAVAGELYDTANVRAIHQLFQQLLPRPVAYMLYAPPGSQKTFVLEHEVAAVNATELAKADGARAFYVYARQGIRPRDFVRRIAQSCGCRCTNEIDQMLNNIRFDFRDQRVLLVIDEAQHLDLESLETVRELLDRPPYFSLLLAGSHDLKKKFDEFSATLEQWNSRIIAKVKLPGLERAEAVGIIQREIGELLDEMPREQADSQIRSLIAGATTRDVFDKNREYINVRTLTNALTQIRTVVAPAAAPEEAA